MRAIDADALQKEYMHEHNGKRLMLIDVAPTIEPERKKGKWIHDGYAFKGGIDWMHCSECGHKDSWSVATRTPFCGWCGAKMEDER